MPALPNSLAVGSVGCAPTESQCLCGCQNWEGREVDGVSGGGPG